MSKRRPNYPGIIAGAIVLFVWGAIWFTALGPAWLVAVGKTRDERACLTLKDQRRVKWIT